MIFSLTMREQQKHSDITRHGFSNSPFSRHSLVRSGSDHNRSRLVNANGRKQEVYDKDVDFTQTNRESDRLGTNRWFHEPGLGEPGWFSEMGLVQSGEYIDERNGSWQKLSGLSESLLGEETRKSTTTSLKFQWDNLLADNNKLNYRNNTGVVVPMCMENGGVSVGGSSMNSFSPKMEMDPTRNYGVIDEMGRNYAAASSPLGKFEVRGRRSRVVDSIVDKIEGSNDIDYEATRGNNMMSERRPLMDNHTCFGKNEKDLDCKNLNFGERRTSIERDNDIDNDIAFGNRMMSETRLGSFGGNEKDLDSENLNLRKRIRTSIVEKIEGTNNIDNDIAFQHNMINERRLLLKNDTAFDENDLDSRNFNLMKTKIPSIEDSNKTRGNDDIDNEIAFGNNMISKRRRMLENDTSFDEDEKDLEYRGSNFMKMRRLTSIVDKIEGNNDIGNVIAFGNNMLYERSILLENDTSFGADGNDLVSRNLNLNPESLQFVEEYGFERHGVSNCSYGDRLARTPIYNEELFTTRSTSQLLDSPEETLEMRLQKNRSSDIETRSDNHKTMLPYDGTKFDEIADSRFGDRDWTYDEIKQLSMLQNARQGHYQGRCPEMMLEEIAIRRNAISEKSLSEQRHSSKPVEPSRINVKKRLGPVQSVKQRLGPPLNAGKSLGSAPKVQKKLPWTTMQGGKDTEYSEQNINVQSLISSELKTKTDVKTEPSEDSEEFMQLVQNAFLKFVKVLNENSATRQEHIEQGGAGTLKCCICGSVKEFVDTLSLAQHAFTSCKVGSRSEHLGFGKALCVLMGWNSKIVPNAPWIRQILPAAEASSLKEDIIIWPPVVLIRNSSIANSNVDERILVSIEALTDILRGMGCDLGVTKLCHGKSANQSTMVVTFSGTFSGLREAERLHKLFAEKKHGRTNFQQVNYFGCKTNCQKIQRGPIDKVESVLYGYMGIASDLDKLDSVTKKRCVVKSRKEIAAIADASLKVNVKLKYVPIVWSEKHSSALSTES